MLKNCPFCGSKPKSTIRVAWCSNQQCMMNVVMTPHKAWNTRPREEELMEVVRQVQKVIDLSSSDDDALEWLKANEELLKVVEETLKKYEVENE